MLIQIAKSVINAKLMTNDPAIKQMVRQALTYQVEGAEYTQGFASGTWDGSSTFFDYHTNKFPAGFVSLVHAVLTHAGHTVQIVAKPRPEPMGPLKPVVDGFGDDPAYRYQDDTVALLVQHGGIIAQVATGGGKSRIANKAVAKIKRKALFITTRKVLMYQMKSAFESGMKSRFRNGEKDLAGQRVGVVGDGTWHPSEGINVGMVQTLAARLKMPDPRLPAADMAKQLGIRAATIDFLSTVELLILEEAHEAGGDGYFEVVNQCSSAHYRLALTATPFMGEKAESNMRLMAVSGPIAIRVTEQELIDKGILATPHFMTIKTECVVDEPLYRTLERERKGNVKLSWSTSWQKAYKLGIVYNRWRNEQILKHTVRAVRLGLPVMILVNQTNHGEILEDMLGAAGLRVRFIHGDSTQAVRAETLDYLAKGVIQVVIGSTIMDVGVDVPALGMVVLAGGGKAEVALRQRIGRGLRRKKTGPNVAFVLDFEDRINSYLYEHYLNRRAVIAGTPGFKERLLAVGVDLDMEDFFKVAA